MPSRDEKRSKRKSSKRKKKKSKKRSISRSRKEKKSYDILEDSKVTRGKKESYGEEPWCLACDCQRCLNGRCGVGWLPVLGLIIAAGIVTLLWFGGALGTVFETSGNDTLEYEICDSCTHEPTGTPTLEPSGVPSVEPTLKPTPTPSVDPTIAPSVEPTLIPTQPPSVEPTLVPSAVPTVEPSLVPTHLPTLIPTPAPSPTPTEDPTPDPTVSPTLDPTSDPTLSPTFDPTSDPTVPPTPDPTSNPTVNPTPAPTYGPTVDPTYKPTFYPTADPTYKPTFYPTADPVSRRRIYDLRSLVTTPNILLIVTENTFSDFSEYHTPIIGDFLRQSYNFSNFYSQFSRGSLMTGQWSMRLGLGKALEACDEGHIPFEVPTWAEQLKLKGYKNYYYGKWNLGADSWYATPLGRGWDSFFGSLNRPDGLEHGDGGSWVKRQAVCPSNLKPNVTFESDGYSQCLMGCYGSQVASLKGSTCRCFYENVCTESSKKSYIYSRVSQRDIIIDWWRGSKPAKPIVGMTGDDLIIKEVLPHLQAVKAERKWTITVSLSSSSNGFTPFRKIRESCKRYFDKDSKDFNFQRGIKCQWMWDSDAKVGSVIDELQKMDLWNNTIVILTNFDDSDDMTILSIGGGALPAKFVRGTNRDLHSVVDVTPTIMAIAGFSDDELESFDLDGVNMIDTNRATAKVHTNQLKGQLGEMTTKENQRAGPSKCGSNQSYTSFLGLRYNAPWLDDMASAIQ